MGRKHVRDPENGRRLRKKPGSKLLRIFAKDIPIISASRDSSRVPDSTETLCVSRLVSRLVALLYLAVVVNQILRCSVRFDPVVDGE